MLSDEQVRDLAEQLYQAEFTRTPMTPISQTHPDADIADAYRIGAIVTELKVAAGRKVKGHKIGLTSRAMQASMQIDEPDFGALLDDMVNHYAVSMASKSGVEVELRISASPPFAAHGHDGRYGQVVRNVIDNALSFSPPDSKIVVELTREPRSGPFVITIDDEGGSVRVDCDPARRHERGSAIACLKHDPPLVAGHGSRGGWVATADCRDAQERHGECRNRGKASPAG